MTIGMGNATAITLQNLTNMGNSSNIAEFFINVNNIVYQGWYLFFMLCVLWFIFYMASQSVRDQPLNNAMYGGATISILSFLARAIFVIQDGVVVGLLTDFQLWIFPLLTITLLSIIWAIKD